MCPESDPILKLEALGSNAKVQELCWVKKQKGLKLRQSQCGEHKEKHHESELMEFSQVLGNPGKVPGKIQC